MIERDYLLRQIHQLIAVLTQVLLHKREEMPDAAQAVLAEGLENALGRPLAALRTLSRAEMRALCTEGDVFNSAKAVVLADLLREDRAAEGRARALWLYEEALHSGAAVPLDVHARMDALRDDQGTRRW